MASTKRKTTEQFILDVETKLGKDYEVIGEYINNKTKIKMFHKVCNTEYEARPHDILVKCTGCPKCNGGISKTLEEFKLQIPDDYEYISGFKNYKTPVKMKHLTCNYEFEMCPSYFSRGRRCPLCGGTKKLTHEEFLSRINKSDDFLEYDILDRYTNYETKINFKHKCCGNIFSMTPDHFIHGERCPYCKSFQSKGIKKIKKILSDNNIEFKIEYKIDGHIGKNNNPYRYDIYIPSLNLIIEYDGEYHFQNKNHPDSLKNQRYNDKIKNSLILNEENLKMIRIPYINLNKIEEILNIILENNEISSETIETYNLLYISDIIYNEDIYYTIK